MDVDLPKIRKKVGLFEFSDVGRYCKAVYEEIRLVKKSFSISDFSELLGFGNNNTMAQIHSGHRNLSEKAGERIADSLKLSRAERSYFLSLVNVKHAATAEERDRLLALILELRARHSESSNNNRALEFFNSWIHSVVFEVLSMQEPQTLEAICEKIMPDVKESAVEKSLVFLESLSMVEIRKEEGSEKRKYIKLQKDFSLGSAVPGLAIVRYHQEMLNLAKDSLITSPPDERDVSSVTISVHPDQIESIKKEIEQLRKHLLSLSSQSQGDGKVMQLNIQLFPLSK